MSRPSVTTQTFRTLGDLQVLEHWAYMRVGQVLVLCTHGDDDASDGDVDSWLTRLAKRDYDKLLVHSHGAAPDAKQRARLAAFWQKFDEHPRCAVLTDSAANRMAMTAMNWISKFEQRAFAGDDLGGALHYLSETEKLDELRDTVGMLSRALQNKMRP